MIKNRNKYKQIIFNKIKLQIIYIIVKVHQNYKIKKLLIIFIKFICKKKMYTMYKIYYKNIKIPIKIKIIENKFITKIVYKLIKLIIKKSCKLYNKNAIQMIFNIKNLFNIKNNRIKLKKLEI